MCAQTLPDAKNVDALDAEARLALRSGHVSEAADLYRRAIELDSQNAALLTSYGAVLHRLGRLPEAAQILDRALGIDQGLAVAHDNLGVVLRLLGQQDESFDHHRRALQLKPDYAQAHANYGLALEKAGETEQACEELQEALRLEPDLTRALCGLGRLLRYRADFDDAEALFRKALKQEPKRPSALSGLADVLLTTGRRPQALRVYRKLARSQPDNPYHKVTLANALTVCGREHEALTLLRRLEHAGINGPAIDWSKAIALSNLGRHQKADSLYRRALAQEPGSAVYRSSYFFAMHAAAKKSPASMLRELKKWESNHGVPVEQRFQNHERKLDPDRPLRVGYISPDFRTHVVRQFFEPVLGLHDSENFEFYCYAELKKPDIASRSLQAFADRWYLTLGKTDQEVATQINRDRIDILVDLAGHTSGNRLRVMSYKPAPVQATYLGYFGSTGLSSIDYWITDEVLHPPDTPVPSTETIYRLPRSGFCYGVMSHSRSTARRNAKDVPVVFGCFNNVSKVSFRVIDTWADILRRCKGSQLILKDRRFALASVRRTWLQRFQRRGITIDRLQLLPNSPHEEYMQAYTSIDIVLDPFPRTGGTTTCDALWMGVPVVTLAGQYYVERLSATKLVAIGAPELVTNTIEDYIDKAVWLAENSAARAKYHATLRQRMARSPLCDPLSLANALEEAYRVFWHRYCAERNSAN